MISLVSVFFFFHDGVHTRRIYLRLTWQPIPSEYRKEGCDGQLVGFAYSNLDGPMMGQNPYTHVDPTQILSVGQGDLGGYTAFDASSSSDDGLGNGVGSSSNVSPESYNTSSASTPPTTEGPSSGQHASRPLQRKYISLHQGAQDVEEKKSMPSPTLGGTKFITKHPRTRRHRATRW